MQRLPILALALIAASCARPDLAKPRIGLAPHPAAEASAAVRRAVTAAAADKAELVAAGGPDEDAAALFDRKLKAIAVEQAYDSVPDRIIDLAKAKRVPVVFFGQEPSPEAMRSWDKLFYVGTRLEEVGAAQGEMLAAYWKADAAADRDGDGTLQYIVLTDSANEEDSVRQAEAAVKALRAAGVPSVMLARETVEDGVAAARKSAARLLDLFGTRTEAFICRDDDQALGVAEALKAAGYAKGGRRIAAVGANPVEPEGGLPAKVAAAIESGAIVGTVFPDGAAQGAAVFDVSYALARGTALWRSGWKLSDAKYFWVPCRKVSKGSLPKN
jgi:methyl-galactoside transport system substrate-binding protein